MTQKPFFCKIESKEISYMRYWLICTVFSLIMILIIHVFLLFFFADFLMSIAIEKNLIYIVIFIFLFNTLLCECNKFYLKKSKKEYNKVIIDNNGILFLNSYNKAIIAKILWKNFQPRDNEKFDVDYIFSSSYRSITLYFIWNLKESYDSRIPSWSPKKIAVMFDKFTNKEALIQTFLTGIATFRSDLTINPDFCLFFKLNPVSFQVDKAIIKKENHMTFIILGLAVLLTLIIIFTVSFL